MPHMMQVHFEGPQFEKVGKEIKAVLSAQEALQQVPNKATAGEKALRRAATKAAEAKVTQSF